ncbi:MAG: LysM peptidoglycan-binding domain-containing protein [Pseudobutyrivibrio sp.]|nr:LysM peptidoglycan-binding domain-containing protein [Pseudobutyrivibrio sp.]
MKKTLNRIVTLVFTFALVLSMKGMALAAPSQYVHNPMDNPKAAKDIVVNDNAVYGFSPSPESERLKEYASYDWTDKATVDAMRAQREEYHASIQELYQIMISMKQAGKSTEEIARVVSAKRNEIRLASYKDDPEGLAKVKKSNLETYGNENGGTAEFFYAKYGSWETVIEKSISANPGADACLGLYDKYYDTYMISGAQPATDIYVVQPGDYLSKIAKDVLGNQYLWRQIYENNKNVISDPNVIRPGQQLDLKNIKPAA